MEAALGEPVGQEARRRPKHPLIEKIDDRRIRARLRRKGLRQKQRRAQINGEMAIELRPVKPPDLVGQVQEAMTAMSQDFQGVERERLASVVSKLLQSGGAIDLKKWVAAIDLTADRAGFLLAHDLAVATEVMRATDEAASVSSKERIKEIVLYSISAEYFALRDKLQITVES